MIKIILNYISKSLFLFALKLNYKKINKTDFKDLNFKQHNFINHKFIKHYVLKENFIVNKDIKDIHTLNFLYFFQKLGGKQGISLAKNNIFLWFNKYKYYKNFPWTHSLPAKRFINIVYNYDFICSISTDKEIISLNNIINFHIKRFLYDVKRKKNEDITSTDMVAFVLINCVNKNFDNNTMEYLKKIIFLQLDVTTMHKSYNLLYHAKFLNDLNEIKNILLFYNIQIPESFNNKILAMTSLLSRYRHEDFSIPLFNGANNNYIKEIQNIINKEQFLKTKTISNVANGIAHYKDNNKTIFFDVVQPTEFNFNKNLNAGSLSLEISADGEKIITNCGGAEISGKNPTYLKYSAAHSTIIINNTNISEINEEDVKKLYPKQVIFESNEYKNFIKFTGSHNGYLHNYKKICKRELKIDNKKSIIMGNDTIISTKSDFEKTVYHIRFHLMPGLSTTITENKKNIIIKTKKNNIWMFRSNNEISIEKSIYIDDDKAIETSQIVINGITNMLKNKVQWFLEKI